MTNKQLAALLRSCRADLRKTKEGFTTHPDGPRWRAAMPKLDKAIAELERPKVIVPNLGPVVENGLAVLLQAPTHETEGLHARTGSFYPAFDTAFGAAGRWVIAPEALTITAQSSSQGGDAFYALGASGLKFWFGHCDRAPATSTKFRKGQRIARVAAISRADGGPHCHLGIDARPLIGRDLRWGANGNGPNYTYGSPTIGAQLTKGLV